MTGRDDNGRREWVDARAEERAEHARGDDLTETDLDYLAEARSQ